MIIVQVSILCSNRRCQERYDPDPILKYVPEKDGILSLVLAICGAQVSGWFFTSDGQHFCPTCKQARDILQRQNPVQGQ